MSPEEKVIREMVLRATGESRIDVVVQRPGLQWMVVLLPLILGVVGTSVWYAIQAPAERNVFLAAIPLYVGILSMGMWIGVMHDRIERLSYHLRIGKKKAFIRYGKAGDESRLTLVEAVEQWGPKPVIGMVERAIRIQGARSPQDIEAEAARRAAEDADAQKKRDAAAANEARRKAAQLATLTALANADQQADSESSAPPERQGGLSLSDPERRAGRLALSEADDASSP